MKALLVNEIVKNLFNTAILVLILAIFFVLANFFLARKCKGERQKKKSRVRILYVCVLIFILSLARIWIEGFTHIFAILGLVSAALVITNKETIMNITAWAIIQWRDLFSEGDLVEIFNHKGYVKTIGVLYMTLCEVTDFFNPKLTGKIIKIPNGLTINNPLINFSQASQISLQTVALFLEDKSNFSQAKSALVDTINRVIGSHYKASVEYSAEKIQKKNLCFARGINLAVEASLSPGPHKENWLALTASFYCFTEDINLLREKILLELIEGLDSKKITYQL